MPALGVGIQPGSLPHPPPALGEGDGPGYPYGVRDTVVRLLFGTIQIDSKLTE